MCIRDRDGVDSGTVVDGIDDVVDGVDSGTVVDGIDDVVDLSLIHISGEVRPDVEIVDLIRLTHGIVIANEQAPDQSRVDPMFEVVIAGIRT